jgi:predicted 2-oxoglutarate/Fe(II)-dependent dioxygenase YbiX
VYYVDAGTNSLDHPLSGVLEFLDPRAGIEAVTAPGDPYGEPLRVRPEAGLLIVFPSWLFHWVHPYVGKTPRIAVSFNATCRALSAVKPGAGETIGRQRAERQMSRVASPLS